MSNKRYSRQLLLGEDYGFDQEKLGGAKVFIAGAGGLGSAASFYLAAAGVGTIIICDSDRVELSNLNRQILHSTPRIGVEKTLSAAGVLSELNPEIKIIPKTAEIKNDPADLIEDADLIIDCLDNVETRYVINDHSIRTGTPVVHGGINGYAGQLSFINPPQTPCIRCIFPEPLQEAGPIPVIGAAAGMIGTMQAMEAIKYFCRNGELLTGKLFIIDGYTFETECIDLERLPGCPACGKL